MNKDYLIYAFVDENTVPYYIGQTYDLRNRMNMHRRFIKDFAEIHKEAKYPYYRKARKLWKCNNFKLILIEEHLTEIEAGKKEEFYIQLHRPTLYNMLNGGKHEQRDKIVSKETKQKISKAKKGIKFSEEHKKQLSIAKTGIKLNLTPEQIEKKRRDAISRFKGKPLSKEHIDRMRIWQTGKKYSVEINKKKGRSGKGHSTAKHYILISPDCTKYELFGLNREFCKSHGLTQSGIWEAIRDKRLYKGWLIVQE